MPHTTVTSSTRAACLVLAPLALLAVACSSEASREDAQSSRAALAISDPGDSADPGSDPGEPGGDPGEGSDPVDDPADAPVSATRTDVQSSCTKVWPMMVPWGVLDCSCYAVSKKCGDASCASCDGLHTTSRLCASRSSILPRTTAACSAAQQDDCAAFCARSCTGGCDVAQSPELEAVDPVE